MTDDEAARINKRIRHLSEGRGYEIRLIWDDERALWLGLATPPRKLRSMGEEKEGILRLQPSGRWAICWPGRLTLEITSGDTFRVEVPGTPELQLTRMEYRHFDRGGEYYSIDEYPLRDGLRAALE
jgi:hypothetical protein